MQPWRRTRSTSTLWHTRGRLIEARQYVLSSAWNEIQPTGTFGAFIGWD